MKIERLSENQIRCTLNKSDLASRQLKISELAYGSDKAKELFRDMMQQASYELGFEAEDIPLMIEAIPISADCIVLIVTKVDNPEELDTRFSKFSPSDEYNDDDYSMDDYTDMEVISNNSAGKNSALPTLNEELDEAENNESNNYVSDELLDLFSKVRDYINKNVKADTTSQPEHAADDGFVPLGESITNSAPSANATQASSVGNSTEGSKPASHMTRIFSFKALDDFIEGAHIVNPIYDDWNSLYKKPLDDKYYLIMQKSLCTSVNFNKTCNILSEYGTKESANDDILGFFNEHCECIIPKHAIKIASRL